MKTANSLKVGVKSKPLAGRIATVFIFLSVLMLPGIVNHAQQLELSQQVLLYAAQIDSVPIDQLAIANSAWLGDEIFRAKVLDKTTGEIYVVNVDRSGKPVTNEEVTDLLRADVEKGFVGKIESSLKQRVSADPAGSSTVCIWVKTTESPRERWRGLLAAGKREQVFSEAREFHAQAEASVLRFVNDRSIRVKYADEYVPVITVEIPNAMLPELEELPEVGRIFDNAQTEPALATSIPTIRAQKVWNAGFTGSAVKVGVVEVPFEGFSAVSGPNPYLIGASFFNPSFTTPSSHAVGVAGVICSTEPFFRGVSHGVTAGNLLSGNASTVFSDQANAATGWAAGQGANVINQSYGDANPTGLLNILSRYDDYIVTQYFCTIAPSAGNNPSAPVGNPAIAYNVIGTGAFAHGGNPDWADDVIAFYSAFGNPQSVHGDREKPDVAAPGNMTTLRESFDPVSGWLKSWQGTSFAAPHVAGTAVLLMSKKPSLKTYPETVKAIIMASAVHNIEGSSRLSSKDGAGGIQAKAAYDVVANGWHSASFVSNGCADLSNAPALFATAGQKVRVVISWLVPIDANLSAYTFADADLAVSSPSHLQTWTSTSFDNNFEIVEFTAPQTGVYTVQACYKAGQTNPIQLMGYAYYKQ